MGFSFKGLVVEIYLLYRIYCDENPEQRHEVLSKDEIKAGLFERYGISWNAEYEAGLHELLLRRDTCGLMEFPDDRYTWLFVYNSEGMHMSSSFFRPALINQIQTYGDLLRSSALEEVRETGNGWMQVYHDAVQTYERMYGIGWEDVLSIESRKELELQNELNVSFTGEEDVTAEEELPF